MVTETKIWIVEFSDGEGDNRFHRYEDVPANVTSDQVRARAQKDYPKRKIVNVSPVGKEERPSASEKEEPPGQKPPKKEEPQRQKPPKQEPPKQEPAKVEPPKQEPPKQEPAKVEPPKQEPQKPPTKPEKEAPPDSAINDIVAQKEKERAEKERAEAERKQKEKEEPTKPVVTPPKQEPPKQEPPKQEPPKPVTAPPKEEPVKPNKTEPAPAQPTQTAPSKQDLPGMRNEIEERLQKMEKSDDPKVRAEAARIRNKLNQEGGQGGVDRPNKPSGSQTGRDQIGSTSDKPGDKPQANTPGSGTATGTEPGKQPGDKPVTGDKPGDKPGTSDKPGTGDRQGTEKPGDKPGTGRDKGEGDTAGNKRGSGYWVPIDNGRIIYRGPPTPTPDNTYPEFKGMLFRNGDIMDNPDRQDKMYKSLLPKLQQYQKNRQAQDDKEQARVDQDLKARQEWEKRNR